MLIVVHIYQNISIESGIGDTMERVQLVQTFLNLLDSDDVQNRPHVQKYSEGVSTHPAVGSSAVYSQNMVNVASGNTRQGMFAGM